MHIYLGIAQSFFLVLQLATLSNQPLTLLFGGLSLGFGVSNIIMLWEKAYPNV